MGRAVPGSWIERGLTAANTLLKGMYRGTYCIISWFGKLKNRFNLFEEGPFMFPLWFGAVSKTLFFKKKQPLKPTKNTQTEEAASWGHFSICICSARNIGGNVPFYSGPDSVLRAFCGEWKENKMKALSSSSATVQQPFLLYVLVYSFHPWRFFRPRPYLPCEPCSEVVTELLVKKYNIFECQCCTDFPSV